LGVEAWETTALYWLSDWRKILLVSNGGKLLNTSTTKTIDGVEPACGHASWLPELPRSYRKWTHGSSSFPPLIHQQNTRNYFSVDIRLKFKIVGVAASTLPVSLLDALQYRHVKTLVH